MTKHICVAGAGISGLGKGIVSAAIARLLKSYGFSVTIQKFDPYLNTDAGCMNPIQHGECFVTVDGKECDLDLGHYKRFIDEDLHKDNSITSGIIYSNVIAKERAGEFLGKTIQIIPHVTNEILEYMHKFDEYDIVIHEIGGTVGDIESLPFVESVRQLKYELGENCSIILLTFLPFINTSQELKTKIAQQGVEKLRSLGIVPDILICRSEKEIDDSIRRKLALFCNVKQNRIIQNLDCKSIYYVPKMLKDEGIIDALREVLNLELDDDESNFDEWNDIVSYNVSTEKLNIGIIGKYTELHDSYLSIIESLRFAGWENKVDVNLVWINAEDIEDNPAMIASYKLDGILIPGGFDDRGTEGMIFACQYAREKKIPYLGICLGMQIACIEFARNVLHLKKANSEEFDKKALHKIIHIMDEQKDIIDKGATMRLGSYPCKLHDEFLERIYGTKKINEVHRHRYEFNNEYREQFESKGMKLSGLSPDGKLVEVVRNENVPFFVGCQYHPEFKSYPSHSEPLFNAFIYYAKNINRVTPGK